MKMTEQTENEQVREVAEQLKKDGIQGMAGNGKVTIPAWVACAVSKSLLQFLDGAEANKSD